MQAARFGHARRGATRPQRLSARPPRKRERCGQVAMAGAVPPPVLLILLALLGAAIFIGARVIQQRTQTKSQASYDTPTLYIFPETITANPGETITVNIFIDSAGAQIVGADVELRYDPQALTVDPEGVERGSLSLFDQFIGGLPGGAKVDNAQGIISLSGLADPNNPNPPIFEGEAGFFASFTATVHASTELRFEFTPGSTTDSNLTEAGTGNDILAQVVNARVDTAGASAPVSVSPPPSAEVLPAVGSRATAYLKRPDGTNDADRYVQVEVVNTYAASKEVSVVLSGNFLALEPSTLYLVKLCDAQGQCRGNQTTIFTTNERGRGTIDYDYTEPLLTQVPTSAILTPFAQENDRCPNNQNTPCFSGVFYPWTEPSPGSAVSTSCNELISLIRAHQFTGCGDDNYSAAADVDNNGVVNILDLSAVVPDYFNTTEGTAWCRSRLDDTTDPCAAGAQPTPEATIPPSGNTTPTEPLLGDYNSDGVVNTLDLSVQYANWGRNPDPSVDLNDDTRVNSVDYGILLQNFSTE